MAKNKYGLNTKQWSKALRSKITSIEAYVGCAGFSFKTVAKTPREFFAVLRYVYGVETKADATFDARVAQAHSAIKGMARESRQESQRKSRDRLAEIGRERFISEATAGQWAIPPVRLRDDMVATASKPVKAKKPATDPSPRAKFYKSWEWRTLRMQMLKKYGPVCMCCGAQKGDETMAGELVKICVDHIRPLATHWHLRLDSSNLQILCDECNQGKGAWDETDWRVQEAVEAQLRYQI